MKLFDVYNQWDITPVKGKGSYIWDKKGKKYLDFYGGHGVISVGHGNEKWKEKIKNQIEDLSFYSNAVINYLQSELAKKLSNQSGYPDYNLFLCNSGAETNENAIKIASFQTGKKKVISFKNAFHGRTAGALAITDNSKLFSPFNYGLDTEILEFNDKVEIENALRNGDVAAVIIEGIQGVAGVIEPEISFLKYLKKLTNEYDALLILDEVQSGFGRTGDFFAHQHSGITPDIITMAKGMGNGFPVAGVLINPVIKSFKGMLGTTFGGNHLACAATLSVLEEIENNNLIENAIAKGNELIQFLTEIESIKNIRGRGLMLGLEFDFPVKDLQKKLLEEGVFTGSSSDPNVLRILPPLNIKSEEIKTFCQKLLTQLKILEPKVCVEI